MRYDGKNIEFILLAKRNVLLIGVIPSRNWRLITRAPWHPVRPWLHHSSERFGLRCITSINRPWNRRYFYRCVVFSSRVVWLYGMRKCSEQCVLNVYFQQCVTTTEQTKWELEFFDFFWTNVLFNFTYHMKKLHVFKLMVLRIQYVLYDNVYFIIELHVTQ